MTLAPTQCAAVVWYYYEDLPVVEVARILVVSEPTVKQHLYQARTRLGADVAGRWLVRVGDGGAIELVPPASLQTC